MDSSFDSSIIKTIIKNMISDIKSVDGVDIEYASELIQYGSGTIVGDLLFSAND